MFYIDGNLNINEIKLTKAGINDMSNSMISIIFLGVLGVLFVLLIVLTIALIVTRNKDSEDDVQDDEDVQDDVVQDDEENVEEKIEDDTALDEIFEDDTALDEPEEEAAIEETAIEEPAIEETAIEEPKGEVPVESEASDEEYPESEPSDNPAEEPIEELEDYTDSAFAPYQEDTSLSNEAIMASVKEAEAMSEAVIHGRNNINSDSAFGLNQELDDFAKKKQIKKNNVSGNDDFYWFNKMDVAEKPSYKTKEMYYHYFNIPKDCIDELLVEMYDCALVRTEEIRYIAYGIEPKAVSLKDILSEGNYYYSEQKRKKEPLPQDLIKIYEKWCGYVDKLFDKIEIHADEYTIQEIRRLLYEFGRNDVDVLIEGK